MLHSHRTSNPLHGNLSSEVVHRDCMELDLEIIGSLIERGVSRGRNDAKE
jgi:hypothetical protein